MFSYFYCKERLWIRIVSLAMSLCFAFYDVSWAGSLSDNTQKTPDNISGIDAEQSQKFAPDYLKSRNSSHEKMVQQKQDLETLDLMRSGIARTEETITLKRPVSAPTVTASRIKSAKGNKVPVAYSQSLTLPEDGQVAIQLKATDANNDPLTYEIRFIPVHGTLAIVPETPGKYIYTPNEGFTGLDYFTYVANDGKVDSQEATVYLTVQDVNKPPIASSVTVPALSEDSSCAIILGGSDEDGDSLSYAIVSGPLHGKLVQDVTDPTGKKYTYTPFDNYNGDDSFTFKVSDGSLDSDISRVNITVNSVNDLPVIDSLADRTVVIGKETSFVLSASDIDNDKLTYQLVGDMPEGATLDNVTGAFTWTPKAIGEYALQFTASDGNGISNVIDIVVTAIEDPVEALRSGMLKETDAEILTVTEEILNLEASIVKAQADLELAKAKVSESMAGAVTSINATIASLDGIKDNIKLTPDTKTDIALYIVEAGSKVAGADAAKSAYFGYLDAKALSNLQSQLGSANRYLNDLNTYKADILQASSLESLNALKSDLPARMYPVPAMVLPLADPSIELNDIADKGIILKEEADIQISVNYPPVLAMPEAPDTAIMGKEITFTLSASDIDSDNITYQLVGDMPEGGSLNQNTGLFTWTPRIIGEYTLQFTASDGNGASNTVYVLIKAIEDPVEVLRGNIITHIDSEITLVTQEIADLEAVIAQAQADLETARVAISMDINDSVLIINTILAYLNEIKENPKLSAATKADMLSYIEEASLVVSSDDIGSAYLQSMEAPISGMRDQLSAANSYLAALNGYKASVNSASDTGTLEALNAVFPERTQPDRPRTVLIEDPRVMLNDLISRGSAIRDIAIAEMSVNYPPILDMPYLPDTVIAGKALTFILSASDIDSSDIAYSLIGEMPEGATLDPVTGAFTWTPKAAGEYAFKFRATDGQAVSNTVAIVISVIADPVEVARTGLLDKTEYEKNLTAQAISDLETRLAQAVADAAAAKAKASEDIAAAEGILSGIVNLLTEDRENPELSDATRSELEAYLAETSSYISGLNALVEAYAGWLDTESIEIDKVLGAEKIYFGDLIDYEDRVNVATELYELKALGFEFPVKMVPNIMPEMPVDDPRIAMNDMISRGNAIAAKVEAEIAENRPPVALAIVVPGFNEDSAQTITLSGTDIDGDTLTYTIVSQPAHGTASISGNTLTYTPQANYNGTDSFTYKVNDGTADSEAATVNLTINAVVDAPLIDAANKKVTAASVSYEDVKAAVDAAASGDTVYIPAGEAVWLKSASTVAITISKSITLKGVEGLTVIRNGNADGTNAFNALIKIDLTADEPVRITGIYFDNRINPNYGHVAGWSGNKSAVLIKGRTYTGVGVALTQIRIDNCTFEKGLRAVAWSGWAYGVVDDNTFINCDIGVGLTGDNNFSWERPIVPGTADTVFIEDNVFIINNDNSYDPNEQIYHQEGARSVVRNNLFDGSAYTNGNSLFYDSHGNQNIYNGDTHHDFRAQPLTEVYDNVFIAYKTYSFMNSRGGSRILFNNTFTLLNGSANVFKLTDEESWQTLFFDTPDTAWAAEDQINNSFFWNNTINGRPLTVTFTKESDKVFIQEGRDYWMHAPDATSGKTVWGHYDENGQLVYDRPGSASMVFIEGPSAYYNPAADPSIGYIPYGVLGEDGKYHHPLTLPPNTAPVATAPVVPSFNEDTPQEITLSATDADNNPLTYTIVSQPAHGMLVADPDNVGKYIYTPDPDYSGKDSFTYIANDGTADSEAATVNLTIAGVNDTPVLVQPAALTGAEDSAITGSLSGTATDVDGNPLTFVLVSNPVHGALTLNADGTYAYTPAANYNGLDSFTYKVNDGTADSEIVTVNLNIDAVVDAPLIDAANKKITAASVSYEDVKAAVDAAVSGDTVLIPIGEAVWTQTLVISKAITLQGAGVGKTIIKNTQGDGSVPQGDEYATIMLSATLAGRIHVTGIEINANRTAQGIYVSGSDWAEYQIDNCKIYESAGRAVYSNGLLSGLIFQNELIDNYKTIDTYGGSAQQNLSWQTELTLGTTKATVVENNIITYQNWYPRSAGATSSHGQGGRTIWRYNTWTNNIDGLDFFPIIDAHGNQMEVDPETNSGGHRASRQLEVYGNTFTNNGGTRSSAVAAQIRGGTALIYDNTYIEGTGHFNSIELREEDSAERFNRLTEYPGQDQNWVWIWNNTVDDMVNGPTTLGWRPTSTYSAAFIIEGTNLFLRAPQQGDPNPDTEYGLVPEGTPFTYNPLSYPHPLTLPPNTPPVATAPVVPSFNEDTPQEITLSATDADNNPLTYTIVSQPAHGMLVADPDNAGKYIYTPDPDYNGEDSFTYIANDGTADSEIATVNLTITAVDDGIQMPVLISDTSNPNVTLVGTWVPPITVRSGYLGDSYIYDGNTGKGTKSATFSSQMAQDGDYGVYISYPAGTGRATNVPVDIILNGAVIKTIIVNQNLNGSQWVLLDTLTDLKAGDTASVRIRNDGTNGSVIVDAVKFDPLARNGIINAASCAYADVKAAIEAASEGDTVMLPAGDFTWTRDSGNTSTKAVVINKSITLQGVEGTIIRNGNPDGTNAFNSLIQVNLLSDKPVRITGIYFDNRINPNYGNVAGWSGYKSAITVIGKDNTGVGTALTQVRIDNCTFEKGLRAIHWSGWAYGVADHNTFVNCDIGISYVGDENLAWNRSIAPGTAAALFIEDNTFIINNDNSYEPNEQIQGGRGMRLVIRNNILDGTAYTQGNSIFFDAHGNMNYYQGTGNDSRANPIMEIYNNTLRAYETYQFANQRGGSMLFYNNTMTTEIGQAAAITVTDEEIWQTLFFDPLDTEWPAEDQINNSFFWNNTMNGAPVTDVYRKSGQAPVEFIQEGRDYFMHAPDATSGKTVWGHYDENGQLVYDRPGSANMVFIAGPSAYYNPAADPSIGYIPYGVLGEDGNYHHPLTLQPNSPPVAAMITVPEFGEDTTQAITLAGTDVDNNPLTYIVVSQPQHGTLTVDPNDPAKYIYKPDRNYNGPDSFVYKVNDGTIDSEQVTVELTVNPVNDIPVFVPIPDNTIYFVVRPGDENVILQYQLVGQDVDRDQIQYSIINAPSFVALDENTGLLTATLSYSDLGKIQDNVTITVSEKPLAGKEFLSVTKTLSIKVREPRILYTASDGTDTGSGEIGQPISLGRANLTALPGDTVYIRGGTYYVGEPMNYPGGDLDHQGINPKYSGMEGSPITYCNYGDEVVNFVGTSDHSFAVNLNCDFNPNPVPMRSYIVVKGLNFSNFSKFLWIVNSSHNEVANCKFQKMYERADGTLPVWQGSTIYRNSQYNYIHDCVFSDYGYQIPDNDGVVFELGNENAYDDFTSYNRIENNEMYHGGHHVIGIHGCYNVVRNNYFHNDAWDKDESGTAWGYRVVYMNGRPTCSHSNLLEGNRIAYGRESYSTYHSGGGGLKISSADNIIRNNMIYDNALNGILLMRYPGGEVDSNHIYSNVIYHNGYYADTTKNSYSEYLTHAIAISGTSSVVETYLRDNVFKNNIFSSNNNLYNPDQPIVAYSQPGYFPTYQIIENNWNEGLSGDPLFVYNGTALDPFGPQPDFRLQSGSGAIDAGGWLTTITSASGSGTTFTVLDAKHFMDGWKVIEGDLIQLEGQKTPVRIISVNYETNAITVDAPLIWVSGQGVGMAYSGDRPDIGAYEYIEVNTPPVATAPVVPSFNEDTPQEITLSATDADNNPLTYTIVSQPSHGMLVADPDNAGKYIYTPDPDYNGEDSFTYIANDGTADSEIATVNLTIAGVNDTPVLVQPAALTGAEDSAITGSLSGTATDADGNPLTFVLVSGPFHGTLTLNADGTYAYTPAANYNGTDSFTYKVNDGTADSEAATVDLTINAVVDAPLIDAANKKVTAASVSYEDVKAAVDAAVSGDTVIVPEGAAVWAKQLDITKGIIFSGSGIDATTITGNVGPTIFLIRYAPSDPSKNEPFRLTGFTFDLNNDSKALSVYNPTEPSISNVRIDHNYFLNCAMPSIQIKGAYGVMDHNKLTGAVHIDVYGNNASSWDNSTFEFGTSDSFFIEYNEIICEETPHSCGAGGRYVIRYNTYTHTGNEGLYPWFDMHGNMGTGGNWSTMGAEIYGNTLIHEYPTAGVRVFDQRGGQAIIFDNEVISTSSCTGRAREEKSDSLNPTTNSQPQHVSNSYYWNNTWGSPSANKLINTYAENVAGVAYSITENVDFFDQDLSFDGTAGVGVGTIADMNLITPQLEGVGYWATDAEGQSALYKATRNGAGVLAWELYYRPYGVLGEDGKYHHPLTLPPNTPPVATAPVVPSFNEDTPQEITLSATDADNNPLTYTIVSQPSHGMLVADPDNAGKYIYTPDPDYNGEDSFTYIANDGTADSEPVNIALTIVGVNDTPILNNIIGQTGIVGQELSFTLSSTDVDSNSLTYQIVDFVPEGATLDPVTGVFSWTPTAAGNYQLKFIATDGDKTSEALIVNLRVDL